MPCIPQTGCGALATMLTAFLSLFEGIGFCSAGEECKMASEEGGRWKGPQTLRCQWQGTPHHSAELCVQALHYNVGCRAG